MKVRYVSPKDLPPRLPIVGTVVTWLFLDRLGAPPLVHGVVWTLWAIVWVLTLCAAFNYTPVRLPLARFEEDKEP